MRTYGRATNPDGTKKWVEVTTDANGFSDWVYVTALCQALLLNLNESPFFAQYGIPAKPDIVQQVQPDFYITRTQQLFAPYFANLVVAKQGSNPPTYKINVTTMQGAKASLNVPIPQ
jgi:hypothetical protein